MKDSSKRVQPHTKILDQPLTAFKKPSWPFPNPASQRFRLCLLLPNGQRMIVALDATLILGRQGENEAGQIRIDLGHLGADSGISRTHALLRWVTGTLLIKDCNSLNGTFLNNSQLYPLRDYSVNDGDRLRLGNVTLQVKFIE